MNEVQTGGLLVRAKRLTSLARQAREDAESVQDHTRTETALVKLDGSLDELETAVKLEAKLVDSGVKSASVLDLTKAPKDLQQHTASVGRPSPQLLAARAKDATKAVNALSDSARSAWADWSQTRLKELPVDRMARLGYERSSIESRVEILKRIAGAPPTADNVDRFLETYQAVSSRLDEVTPEGPLDALLAKFPCHLDQLTDDELRLLRVEHPGIGAQIVLRFE